MADPDTRKRLPDDVDDDFAPASGRLRPVRPVVPEDRSAPAEAPNMERLQPIGADNDEGVVSAEASRLQPITYKDRQRLPMVSPGAPAGSRASYEAQLERLEDQKAHPWGTPENHPGFGGRLAHIAAKAGNIAGDIVAPAQMALIPGTDLNREVEIQGARRNLGAAETRESETRLRSAQAENQEAEAYLRTHPKDKPIGAPQITGDDELMQEFQHPDGSVSMEDLHVKGKPNVALTTIEDPDNPGHNITVGVNKNDIGQAPTKVGGGKVSTAPPKTVVMQGPDQKNYEYQFDPKGNYTGDEGYGQWKKIGPAKPDAMSLGLIGSLTPLIDPNTGELKGTINTKNGEIKPLTAAQQSALNQGGGGTTPQAARAANQVKNQFNTQYEKPATDAEQNFQKFQEAYREYQKNPETGAASMVAIAQHLGTTLGSVKGAQIGEHVFQEHKDAIGIFDRIERFVDQAATGQQLSAAQWRDFNELITNARQIQWETTAREAVRRHVPVDMVPADVKIPLRTPGGKLLPIAGNRVEEALKDGLTF